MYISNPPQPTPITWGLLYMNVNDHFILTDYNYSLYRFLGCQLSWQCGISITKDDGYGGSIFPRSCIYWATFTFYSNPPSLALLHPQEGFFFRAIRRSQASQRLLGLLGLTQLTRHGLGLRMESLIFNKMPKCQNENGHSPLEQIYPDEMPPLYL